MSFLSNLFSPGSDLAKPIDAIGDVIDKAFTSDDERLNARNVLAKIQQQIDLAQIDLNKTDSQNRSIFISGWRPFIGWICGICVGIYYLTQAIVLNWMWVYMSIKTGSLVAFPGDPHGLIELAGGVLGIYGFQRTMEKIKGVSS